MPMSFKNLLRPKGQSPWLRVGTNLSPQDSLKAIHTKELFIFKFVIDEHFESD